MDRGRKILIVWAGRHWRGRWAELYADYRSRIARIVPVEEIPVRARSAGEGKARLQAEGGALLAALPEDVWTVALDRRGRQMSSPEFASWLATLRRDWPHPIAFLVGSDLGIDPTVLGKARDRLSLGPMTLPHELSRLVLYEQIYRALSIEAGIKYHRQPL